jgi:UDP-N-acetylmuramate dehydrogenase
MLQRSAYARLVALEIRDDVPLAPLTTLELGGPARHLALARTDDELGEALRWAEARQLPALILGGGSNLVVADAGFPGLAVRVATRGRAFADAGGGAVLVTAAAGEPWDDLVADTVARELAGLECLSGIPGLVGATPIQNVGAYGQEVAETIRAVRVLERATGRVRDLSPADCAFAYRDSAFKRDPDRFAVLAVTFALRPGGPPTLRYAELAGAMADRPHPTLDDARRAVIALRRKKSMVIADGDPNRRSVGSFFTNPIVSPADAAAVAAHAAARGAGADELPRWPAPGGNVKLSAAWLIEHAGFGKGARRGTVGISTAHALALVNHGGGSTAALLSLAGEIRDAVRAAFGVTLLPEPTLITAAWPAPGT